MTLSLIPTRSCLASTDVHAPHLPIRLQPLPQRIMNQQLHIHGVQRLHEFIQTRLRHADTHTLNLLNTSIGAWLRYYGFLQIVRARYQQATVEFVEAMQRQHEARKSEPSGSRPMTPEELAEMQRTADIGNRLHLEIESFHIFANILLDRIASTFRYYFWKKANWNHRHLMTNLESICVSRKFQLPDTELLKMPRELDEKIVAYRNTRVEHVEEPRLLFATTWGADKKAKIYPTLLYPTDGEAKSVQKPSADIDELMALLDRYMIALLNFFEANADQSILPPTS